MGDAGVSLAEGHDAVFYNPAGVADIKSLVNELILASPEVELSSNAKEIYRTADDGADTLKIVKAIVNQPVHIAETNYTGTVFRRAALSIFERVQADAFVGTNPERGVLEADLKMVGRGGLILTSSRSFLNDSLLVGVNTKVMHKANGSVTVDALSAESQFKDSSVKDLRSKYLRRGTGIGGDLGFLYKMSGNLKPRLGVMIHNMGGTNYKWPVPKTSKGPDSDKQTVDVGLSVAPGTKRSYSTLAVDLHDATNSSESVIYKRLHLGARISFDNVFGLMAGLNQGYPTYGGFLDLKLVRVEGGVYSEELGELPGDRKSRRVFGRVSVGWTR
jgi:hypothetical protein